MGVQRPAEHHYIRRRPPPERRVLPASIDDGHRGVLRAEIYADVSAPVEEFAGDDRCVVLRFQGDKAVLSQAVDADSAVLVAAEGLAVRFGRVGTVQKHVTVWQHTGLRQP